MIRAKAIEIWALRESQIRRALGNWQISRVRRARNLFANVKSLDRAGSASLVAARQRILMQSGGFACRGERLPLALLKNKVNHCIVNKTQRTFARVTLKIRGRIKMAKAAAKKPARKAVAKKKPAKKSAAKKSMRKSAVKKGARKAAAKKKPAKKAAKKGARKAAAKKKKAPAKRKKPAPAASSPPSSPAM